MSVFMTCSLKQQGTSTSRLALKDSVSFPDLSKLLIYAFVNCLHKLHVCYPMLVLTAFVESVQQTMSHARFNTGHRTQTQVSLQRVSYQKQRAFICWVF